MAYLTPNSEHSCHTHQISEVAAALIRMSPANSTQFPTQSEMICGSGYGTLEEVNAAETAVDREAEVCSCDSSSLSAYCSLKDRLENLTTDLDFANHPMDSKAEISQFHATRSNVKLPHCLLDSILSIMNDICVGMSILIDSTTIALLTTLPASFIIYHLKKMEIQHLIKSSYQFSFRRLLDDLFCVQSFRLTLFNIFRHCVNPFKIVPSDITADDYFGYGVALASDYSFVLIGAPFQSVGSNSEQGAVYAFLRNDTKWYQHQNLTSSDGLTNDLFGYSVAVSGDVALIGALQNDAPLNGQGTAYIFLRSSGFWSESEILVASDAGTGDNFGSSVALSGDYALVGAYLANVGVNADRGSAYVFYFNGLQWNEQAMLVASDGVAYDAFGWSVSTDGEYAVVSAIWDYTSAAYQGSAYVFRRSGTDWSQQAKLFDSGVDQNSYFGTSVLISGNFIFIGAQGADIGYNIGQGAVFVYQNNETEWDQKLVKSEGDTYDSFGYSLSSSGDYLAIGVLLDDVTTGNQGSVVIFKRADNVWTEFMTLVAPDASSTDYFGFSVALSPEFLLIGASFCDEGSKADSGAVYSFYNNSGSWEFVCDPGYNIIGNSLCLPCELGKYKDWLGTTCLNCPTGRYSQSTGSLSCNLCETGQYNDLTGQSSCVDCPLGKYNPNSESVDLSACLDCPTGSYLPFAGASLIGDCINCPIGTYSEITGAQDDDDCTSCDSILSGSSSDSGSSDVSDCVCPSSFFEYGGSCTCAVGYGFDGESCLSCSEDSIKSDISLSTCMSCKSDDPNSVSNADKTACICDAGFVSDSIGSECLKCAVGIICDDEGSVLTSVSLELGYWRESSTDLSTRECPYESACTGSSDISNQCMDGHAGPLCAVCEDGYDSGSRFEECEPCFKGSTSTSFWSFAVVIILLILLFLFSLCRNISFIKRLAALVISFVTPSVRVKLKIVLIYCQIISQFQSILSADYPSNYSRFLSVLQIFNFDMSSILSLKCFNQQYMFHDEMVVSTLLPISICLLLLIGYSWSSFFSGDSSSRQQSRWSLVDWLLFVLYFFFSSASGVVFEMFNCDTDFESGSSYLRADYRLTCSGSTYELYRSYAIFMIFVYPIGIPLLFFSVLFSRRSIINMEAEEAAQGLESYLQENAGSSNLEQLDNLVVDFKMSHQLSLKQYENARCSRLFKQEIEGRLKIDYSRVLPELIPIAFLYEAYRPEVWYFECVECVRRLSLTGLLIFMYPGSDKQILLAMLLCVIFIILYSWVRPFLNPVHNLIIGSAKWGIFLQLYGTLLLKQNQFEGTSALIGDLMIVVGTLFPLLPFFDRKFIIEGLKQSVGGTRQKALTAKNSEVFL